jgi:hypothetical protein
MTRHTLPLLLLALVATSCSDQRDHQAGPFVRATSPVDAASGQPRFTTDGERLFLSWVERSDTIAILRFAERIGEGWSEPVEVARGADWFVNWADTPGVVALGGNAFAGFYLQRTGRGTYDYAIRVVQSRDGGKTWSQPVTPHDEGTPSEYGFISARPERGGLRMVWLDGTAMASDDGGHRGAMALRTTVLAPDGGMSGTAMLDDRTCECCPTAMVITSRGPLVAYRDRSPEEIRDIAVVRASAGEWSAPVVPLPDGWRIEGCPVNGPALSAAGGRVVLASFTGAGGGVVKAAFSEDGGETFGNPVRLDAGRPLGRVDVGVTPAGDALVSWLEYAGETAELRLRRVAPDGTLGEPVVAAQVDESRAAGMPRLMIYGDEVLVAWVATSPTTHVTLVSARLSDLE